MPLCSLRLLPVFVVVISNMFKDFAAVKNVVVELTDFQLSYREVNLLKNDAIISILLF